MKKAFVTFAAVIFIIALISCKKANPASPSVPTDIPTVTSTCTVIGTASVTETYTNTGTFTVTMTITITGTFTETKTATVSATFTESPTKTMTATITNTATCTVTPTITPCTASFTFGFSSGSPSAGIAGPAMEFSRYNNTAYASVTGFSVFSLNTGSGLVAVYSDNNGAPGTLIVQTASTAISTISGWNSIPLASPIVLAPGDYWLAVAANANGIITVMDSAASTSYFLALDDYNAAQSLPSEYAAIPNWMAYSENTLTLVRAVYTCP